MREREKGKERSININNLYNYKSLQNMYTFSKKKKIKRVTVSVGYYIVLLRFSLLSVITNFVE